MNFAPGLPEFIERANKVLPPDYHRRPIPEQRELYSNLIRAFPRARPTGVDVVDDAVTVDGHTVRLRIYRVSDEPGQPVYLYFRGGGFVLADVETHDTIVAEVAAMSGTTAIAVDFRPAPEHQFPAPIEDGWTALRGVVAEAERLRIDPDRIGVAGESSGANIAVGLCMVTRDRGGPRIAAQALISPVLDFSRWRAGGEDSPLLSGDEMVYFTACYVGDQANLEHPYVSPLRSGTFDGLPPAFIMAAELDSLRVDAEQYAERLRAAGTPVELVTEPGFIHACIRARVASQEVADAFQRYGEKAARLLGVTPPPPGSAPPWFHFETRTDVAEPGKRYAVVVDPYSSGNMVAPVLHEHGLSAIAMCSAPRPPVFVTTTWRPQDFDHVFLADPDMALNVERLRQFQPVGVIPGAEVGVELADTLAAELIPELANDPKLIAARRQKDAMARAVAAAGVPVPKQISTTDPAEVEAWIEREGLTGRALVVKPPVSGGTDGVSIVPAGDDWRPVFDELIGRFNALGVFNDRVVVQEFLEGTEYVVDTFTANGRHIVTNLCVYKKVVSPTGAMLYDTMEFIAEDPTPGRVLVPFTKRVLDAIGVRNAAAHTEVMLTADGPRHIESAARLHGGGHPVFCRLATGDSQLDRMVAHFAGAPVNGDFHLERTVLVVFLGAARAGRVANAEVLDRAADLPTHYRSALHVHTGDVVVETRDLMSLLGFVVLADESRDRVFEDYRALKELEGSLVIEPELTGAGRR